MKKRVLSLLITLTIVMCLFSGLTVTASAAATQASGALGSGMVVVDVTIQNNSNYASAGWSGYLFNGANKSVSVSSNVTLGNGDIYSVDYDTGTVGVVVPLGSDAWTAVKDVLDSAKVSYTYGTYLTSVNSLDGTINNYWAFYHKVGSTYYYANLGLSSYIVSSGETICLAYNTNGTDGIGYTMPATPSSSAGFYFGGGGSLACSNGTYTLSLFQDATSFTLKSTPNSTTKTVKIYSAGHDSYGYYMGAYLGGLNTAITCAEGNIFCIVEGSEEYEYYFSVSKSLVGSDLALYSSGGYDYSMLGNKWTSSNPLVCAAGETASNLRYGYDSVSSTMFRYMSACTNVTVSDMSKLSVTLYYGNTYSATGSGYTSVSIPTSNASGNVGSINYKNYDVANAYGAYYDIEIYPDTTTTGTYYYYVIIEDTVNHKTITSIGSQAVVKVGRLYAWASTSNGVMTVKYITVATSSLDSGNYYLKYQAKDSSGLGLYFFTASYAKDAIPASGSVELSGAAKMEISLVKASDGSVADTITVS